MPVRPEYIFTIAAPYVRSALDDAEITADTANGLKWKDGYSTFKNNIRNFLKLAQNAKCAFCRCEIPTGVAYSTLEHLVPKSAYPQFEFLPNNLVFCCWPCNRSKNKSGTLQNPVAQRDQQQFPINGAGFTIVNPYHDNYEAHIDFFDEVIIVSLNNSIKGDNTIKFYSLTRPELAEQRAREFKLNKIDIHHRLLLRLANGATPQPILDQINQIILQMPNWVINL